MKVAFLLQSIPLLALRGTLEVNAAKKKLLDLCTADCDCLGWDTDPSIRCEYRHISLGKRCYKDFSLSLNESCTKDSDCISQFCENDICTIHPKKPPVTDHCRYDQKVVGIVDGERPDPKGVGTCPCANAQYSSVASAQSMFDLENPSKKTYSNNYGLGLAFDLISIKSGPVRSIRICSGDGPYMRDPKYYKLFSKCPISSNWKLVQEGTIRFPDRDEQAKNGTGKYVKECTVVRIGHQSFSNRYKITFPTQRGGDLCACQNYPTEFSELSLRGPCSQVGPAPLTARPVARTTARPIAPTPPTEAPIPSPTTPKSGISAFDSQQAAPIPSPTARTTARPIAPTPAPIPSPTAQGGAGGQQGTCKYELSIIALVNGAQPYGSQTCPCAHPHHASLSNAQSMVAFENPSLETYANNYGLGSGLEFTTKTSGPIRTMRICSGDGPYMRDPTSFMLASRCQSASAFRVFQEGPLRFLNRVRSVQSGTGAAVKECIEVKIRDTTSCNEYRITFPTQRGGDSTCSLVDACQNYPTEISELSFSRPCSQIDATPAAK